MSPEIEQKFEEMQEQINTLNAQLEFFKNASEFDPETIRTIGLLLSEDSGFSVTDYDRAVDEAGLSSYTVAKVYDGMLKIGNRVVGYYNEV